MHDHTVHQQILVLIGVHCFFSKLVEALQRIKGRLHKALERYSPQQHHSSVLPTSVSSLPSNIQVRGYYSLLLFSRFFPRKSIIYVYILGIKFNTSHISTVSLSLLPPLTMSQPAAPRNIRRLNVPESMYNSWIEST